MFSGIDLAHWEFIGIVVGLILACVDVASGERVNPVLRSTIGFLGAGLSVLCLILLFGFSGVKLRSPVSLRSPLVFPILTASPTPKRCQLTATVDSHLGKLCISVSVRV
jgi:hypothetical protein